MKIIHFADLHLGVENYGHFDAATGLHSRLLDFLAAFDKLVDYAIESKTDLVLFCGDAYKNREPGQTQQREFAKRIKRLSENNIPVFLLVGNHDLPNSLGRATSTEIFDTLAVRNVHVSSKPEIIHIETKSGPVQIASLPWLRRSSLLTREEMKGLDMEQITWKMDEVLTGIVKQHTENLDRQVPAILAAHVWITGTSLGSERSMSLGNEHGLLLSSVADPVFDYVALGHIHKQQVLSEHPPVTYSGSLERIDFGEEKDEKGFYEVDINTDTSGSHNTTYNFRVIQGRPFLTINVSIKPDDQLPTESVVQAIKSHPIDGAIVRLQISLPEQGSSRINELDIRNALAPAAFFSIARDISREARMRLGKYMAEELTPLNALKTYLETKKVSSERAKVLLEYGEKLIEETKD